MSDYFDPTDPVYTSPDTSSGSGDSSSGDPLYGMQSGITPSSGSSSSGSSDPIYGMQSPSSNKSDTSTSSSDTSSGGGALSKIASALGLDSKNAPAVITALGTLLGAAGHFQTSKALQPKFAPPPLFPVTTNAGGAATGYGPTGGYNYKNYQGAVSGTPGTGYAPTTQAAPMPTQSYYTYGHGPEQQQFQQVTGGAPIAPLNPNPHKKGGHIKKFADGGLNTGNQGALQPGILGGTPLNQLGPPQDVTAQTGDGMARPNLGQMGLTPTPAGGGALSGVLNGNTPATAMNPAFNTGPSGGSMGPVGGPQPGTQAYYQALIKQNGQPWADQNLTNLGNGQWGEGKNAPWTPPGSTTTPGPNGSTISSYNGPKMQYDPTVGHDVPITGPGAGWIGSGGPSYAPTSPSQTGLQAAPAAPMAPPGAPTPAAQPPGGALSALRPTIPNMGARPMQPMTRPSILPTRPMPRPGMMPPRMGIGAPIPGGQIRRAAGGSSSESLTDPRSSLIPSTGQSAGAPIVGSGETGLAGRLPSFHRGPGIQSHIPNLAAGGALNAMNPGTSRYVRGPGDGTSDDINAKLANGEYVLSADVVSSLGNGDNNSGAKNLDQFVHNVRTHKAQNMSKGKLPADAKPIAHYIGGRA